MNWPRTIKFIYIYITLRQSVAVVPHILHPMQGEQVFDAVSLNVPPGHFVSQVVI